MDKLLIAKELSRRDRLIGGHKEQIISTDIFKGYLTEINRPSEERQIRQIFHTPPISNEKQIKCDRQVRKGRKNIRSELNESFLVNIDLREGGINSP